MSFLTSVILGILFLAGAAPAARAEVVHFKNGSIAHVEVLYRKQHTLWVRQASGAVGIELSAVERITQNDGSPSRYDYESIFAAIERLVGERQYRRAAAFCSLLLESFPAEPRLRALRASLLQQAGDVQEALAEYSLLIESGAADAAALNDAAGLYARLHRLAEAQALLVRALARDPGLVAARQNLADIFFQRKELSSAAREYQLVLQREPDNVRVLYNLGRVREQQGDTEAARQQWERVLSLNPGDPEAGAALNCLEKRQ